MEPTRGTRAANGLLGATTLALFPAGLACAAWMSTWAVYAWGARDESWILAYGALTLLALALPVAFVRGHERWQARHGRYAETPTAGTKALNAACGIVAALLCLVALPFIVLFGYLAWMFWADGALGASVYFGAVALAMLVEPVALLVHYDRWQTANGLR